MLLFKTCRECTPSSPLPPQGCAGVGVAVLFLARSLDFGYGFEAVRIRVRNYQENS
jgi:hypothetical protein